MRLPLFGLVLASAALMGVKGEKSNNGLGNDGLKLGAYVQLHNAGVDKYLGQFTPASSTALGDGWTRYDYDPDGGNGPVCIGGSTYSVYARAGSDPSKLLIFEQGGGACWQNFYQCTTTVAGNPIPFPIPQVDAVGIWNRSNPANPFADYSAVYMPYCDGSVFSGDNDVLDANFPGGIRRHRGLRNQSAGMDLAKSLFPGATTITLAGSSAGGVGVAGFAGALARFAYGNGVDLTIFNDAGPVAVNLDPSQADAIAARANDWQFGQFYPASCQQCDDMGQATGIIDWRLKNDRDIREAVYDTDADTTNRFFLGLLGPGGQQIWEDLWVAEHGALNAAYPDRYKRFFVADSSTHTALQTGLFYTYSPNAGGLSLSQWTADFLADAAGWVDNVEP
jgi:hypothetical protein